MQNLYKSDFFVLRTPLITFEKFTSFINSIHGKFNSSKIKEFSDVFTDPQLLEAIYIASPSLHSQLKKYLNNEVTDEKKIKSLYKSLYKYYSRMSTRSTPFGLFSGCSVGDFANETILNLEDRYSVHRHLRLDMDFLCRLVVDILKNENVINELLYYPNSSIYKLGNQYRFVEYRYFNNKRTHHLVTIAYNSITKYILNCAKAGVSKKYLIQCIVEKGYQYEDAVLFVDDLINNQVLKSELDANVSGDEYAHEIIHILSKKLSTNKYYLMLRFIQEKIQQINVNPSVEKYEEIINILNENAIPFNENNLFQVDLVKHPIKANLSCEIKNRILDGLKTLYCLNPVNLNNQKLEQFKRAFSEKYEDRIVSISEVMDTESGLGYKNAITVQDIYKGNAILSNNPESKFKIEKFRNAVQNNFFEIIISPDEVTKFIKPIKLPNSVSVMASILHNSKTKSDEIIIKTVSGPSGANLLGRFCHSDQDMYKRVLKLIDKEESIDSEKIFAEIVHLPQSRVGNVLSRPILRKYEIPYLAKSTLKIDNQIFVNDLYVKFDRGQNRLILYSRKLDKEVVPRMSNAHNFSFDSLPIYNFLCDLQGDNMQRSVFWSWDSLSNEDFLPRVKYDNIILSLATWNLKVDLFSDIFTSKAEKISTFTKIKQKIRLPKYVTIVEGDNELFIDTENEFCINLLLENIRKRKTVKIHEFPFNEQNLIVHTDDGLLTNEVIIPFVKIEPDIKKQVSLSFNENNIKRNFPIGTEWAYFKLYIEKKTGDDFVKDNLLKIVQNLKSKQIIDKYFFIRYNDPKYHLRIRFHLTSINHYSMLLQIINKAIKPLFEVNAISSFQMDTYSRELERYGFKLIDKVEELFSFNSDLILKLFRKFSLIDSENFRMSTSMVFIEQLLKVWGLNIYQRMEIYEYGYRSFVIEFSIESNKNLKNQLNDNFRKLRPLINKLLSDEVEKNSASDYIISEINKQVNLIVTIRNLLPQENHLNVNSFIWSLIHMHVNRIMFDEARKKEMMIYFYLRQFYISIIAKEKKILNQSKM